MKESHLAVCIVSMIQMGTSFPTLTQMCYGVRWAHKLTGYKDPLKATLIRAIYDSAKRMLSKPTTKKEPIAPCHLTKLAKKFGHNSATLSDLRLLSICTLDFAGFLRCSELANIRRNDIIFHKKYIEVFIEKSKTDKFREGAWIFTAKIYNITCPVSTLKRYLKRLQISPSSEDYIFKGFYYSKKLRQHVCKQAKKPVSYSRAREIVFEAFEKIGLPKNKFGLHSLMSGEATTAANVGIPDRLFKKHGRWRYEKAKDGYVKHSIKSLLYVNSKLGT